MAIVDPAADYIASQKETLTDFIFRMTGDRSRAGITASEVSESVHRELLSSWTLQDIRVELFAYAFEVNADAFRGIEKSFLEGYYRNNLKDATSIGAFYPLEIFLLEQVGIERSLTILLMERFHFTPEESARILDKNLENVEDDRKAFRDLAKKHPKIKVDLLSALPHYNFLVEHEPHQTALSHILVSMKTKRFSWGTRVFLTLIILGLVIGWVAYLLSESSSTP